MINAFSIDLTSFPLFRRFINGLYNKAPWAYSFFYKIYKSISDINERRIIRSIIMPGDVVLDIGANIGIYTKVLVDCVGPNGLVYAFEPSPENFSRLKVRMGNIANVKLLNTAVGYYSGELNLYLSDDMNVDHRTYDTGDGRKKHTVPCIRLDDMYDEFSSVKFIKIDIQGYELSAFKGMERLLIENRTLQILMEYWPYGIKNAGDEPKKVIQFLVDRGFEIKKIYKNKLLNFDVDEISESTRNYCNLLAIKKIVVE